MIGCVLRTMWRVLRSSRAMARELVDDGRLKD
jgi:hypothetical protein